MLQQCKGAALSKALGMSEYGKAKKQKEKLAGVVDSEDNNGTERVM